MIILFVNIKLLMNSCLSKKFPGRLHEASRKCIGMILVFFVYVRVAQSVEDVASYGKLFYLWASRGTSPTVYLFFILFLFYFISLSFITLCFILILLFQIQ